MPRCLIAYISVIVIGLIGYAFYTFFSRPAPPVLAVMANDPFDDYERNAAAADERYKGKRITVRGTLVGMGTGPNAWIHLPGVKCMVPEYAEGQVGRLAPIEREVVVEVTGTCTGRNQPGPVMLIDCTLVRKREAP